MPHPLLIINQSVCLIQAVDINSHTEWQTVQIKISWLLQKPTDLDLHCLQRQGISGFSRTRVNLLNIFGRFLPFLLGRQVLWLSVCFTAHWATAEKGSTLNCKKLLSFPSNPYMRKEPKNILQSYFLWNVYNSLSNVHGISQNLLLNSLLPPPPPLNHTQTKWQKFSLVCLPVFHANLCTVDSHYLDLPYLEVKIWSLLWHGNLKTGIKILWKRGEIAPFPQYFQYTA